MIRAVLSVGLLSALWLLVSSCARWAAEAEDPVIDTLIKPPRPHYTGADEALQARTQQKRHAADKIRRRASQVESGSAGADLRLVTKK